MKFLKSPLGICWLIYIGLALIMVIAMMFVGIRAWSSTTDKCASELPSDLWTLFKVTVVLYSIAGILLLCVTCCFGTAVLCGFPLDGSMGYEPGVAGSAPAYTCDNSDYSSYEKAEGGRLCAHSHSAIAQLHEHPATFCVSASSAIAVLAQQAQSHALDQVHHSPMSAYSLTAQLSWCNCLAC